MTVHRPRKGQLLNLSDVVYCLMVDADRDEVIIVAVSSENPLFINAVVITWLPLVKGNG